MTDRATIIPRSVQEADRYRLGNQEHFFRNAPVRLVILQVPNQVNWSLISNEFEVVGLHAVFCHACPIQGYVHDFSIIPINVCDAYSATHAKIIHLLLRQIHQADRYRLGFQYQVTRDAPAHLVRLNFLYQVHGTQIIRGHGAVGRHVAPGRIIPKWFHLHNLGVMPVESGNTYLTTHSQVTHFPPRRLQNEYPTGGLNDTQPSTSASADTDMAILGGSDMINHATRIIPRGISSLRYDHRPLQDGWSGGHNVGNSHVVGGMVSQGRPLPLPCLPRSA